MVCPKGFILSHLLASSGSAVLMQTSAAASRRVICTLVKTVVFRMMVVESRGL